MLRFAPLALLLAVSVPAFAQPAVPDAPRGRPDPARIFQELDQNRDGRVTFDEGWARVQTRFVEADANRDGFLTPDEFRNLRPGPRRDAATGERAERRERFAQARFRGADANSDGRVALEELRPMAEAMFRMMDANADSVVTQEELPRRWRGMRPD